MSAPDAAPDDTQDWDAIKAEFLAILRDEAIASDDVPSVTADDDDPLGYLSVLFAEPDPADMPPDGPAVAPSGEVVTEPGAEPAEPGDGPGDEPGAEVLEEPANVSQGEAAPAVAWKEFLAAYGAEWKGTAEHWMDYAGFIRLYARDLGVADEAEKFLAAAEAEPDLGARVAFFARHGVTIAGKTVTFEKPKVAKVDGAGDKQVVLVVSTAKEKDDEGEFVYANVEDAGFGKVYLSSKKFVADKNSDRANIPTADSRGRKVDEVAPDVDGGRYMVRIGKLWGWIEPVPSRKFVGVRPTDDAYSDWATRTVTKNGYRDSAGNEVNGDWYKPWPQLDVYLFEQDHDQPATREWAKGAQLTGKPADGTLPPSIDEVLKAAGRDREYAWFNGEVF